MEFWGLEFCCRKAAGSCLPVYETAFCHEILHLYVILSVHRITQVTFAACLNEHDHCLLTSKRSKSGCFFVGKMLDWITNNGRSVQEYEFAKTIPIWLFTSFY